MPTVRTREGGLVRVPRPGNRLCVTQLIGGFASGKTARPSFNVPRYFRLASPAESTLARTVVLLLREGAKLSNRMLLDERDAVNK